MRGDRGDRKDTQKASDVSVNRDIARAQSEGTSMVGRLVRRGREVVERLRPSERKKPEDIQRQVETDRNRRDVQKDGGAQGDQPVVREKVTPGEKLTIVFERQVLKPEAREPDSQDAFRVRIRLEMSEYRVLQEHGMTEEQIRDGIFTRQQLRDAGFFFVNRLGGGEKGIMSGQIPDLNDSTRILDFTNRALLTRKEVEIIYAYQRAHPDVYGSRGEDLNEVRKDMLSFLVMATAESAFLGPGDFIRQALPGLSERGGYSMNMWDEMEGKQIDTIAPDKVSTYWQRQREVMQSKMRDANSVQVETAVAEQFTKTYCADIYDWDSKTPLFGMKEVRDHHIKAINVRIGKLAGQGSPFLESGFVFNSNPDADVYLRVTDGSSGTRRINMASLHIAGGHPDFPGLSEMGGRGDQIYMPTGLYIDRLYTSDPVARAALHTKEVTALSQDARNEIADEVQRRLIRVALEA